MTNGPDQFQPSPSHPHGRKKKMNKRKTEFAMNTPPTTNANPYLFM